MFRYKSSLGAPPIALVDNTLCPANEKVYDFLDKVMTQVAELFPFDYIHVGGDECPKNMWEKSDAIKALMEKEGLKNMEEVQSYFEKRLEKIVESKGKKFLGWDEILGRRFSAKRRCNELARNEGWDILAELTFLEILLMEQDS